MATLLRLAIPHVQRSLLRFTATHSSASANNWTTLNPGVRGYHSMSPAGHVTTNNSITTSHRLLPDLMPVRTKVYFSKRGKPKPVKAAVKRFFITGTGHIKYWMGGEKRYLYRISNHPHAKRHPKAQRKVRKTQYKLIRELLK